MFVCVCACVCRLNYVYGINMLIVTLQSPTSLALQNLFTVSYRMNKFKKNHAEYKIFVLNCSAKLSIRTLISKNNSV